MRTATSKLYNERALLLALCPQNSDYAPVQFYCRPVKSFIYGSTRFYHVRACDSLFGKVTGPIYCYPQDALEDTRRRFGKDGLEMKRK